MTTNKEPETAEEAMHLYDNADDPLEAMKSIMLASEKRGMEKARLIVSELPVDKRRCADLLLPEQAWLESNEACNDAILAAITSQRKEEK